MRFNSAELAEFATPAGEHEGRLTHKPPPRTLYDTSYKERWFKLRANFLFYYRLNEFGGVEKNEPTGVFVLENCEVRREEDAEAPFGFAIQWKEEPEKKHLFFAKSEQSVHTWVTKIVQASYEHLRAQMIMLRVQIRRKTGKDPFEYMGTPLPQRVTWGQDRQESLSLEGLSISGDTPVMHASSALSNSASASAASDKIFCLPSKSPRLFRRSPVPPPRKAKKTTVENGCAGADVNRVRKSKASFKSHVNEPQVIDSSTEAIETNQVIVGRSSFISHVND